MNNNKYFPIDVLLSCVHGKKASIRIDNIYLIRYSVQFEKIYLQDRKFGASYPLNSTLWDIDIANNGYPNKAHSSFFHVFLKQELTTILEGDNSSVLGNPQSRVVI